MRMLVRIGNRSSPIVIVARGRMPILVTTKLHWKGTIPLDAITTVKIQNVSELGKTVWEQQIPAASAEMVRAQVDEEIVAVDSRDVYSVNVQIRSLDGRLLYMTDRLNPVITNGIHHVNITLIGEQG
mmetsp:Transcript_24149/g.56354  ORF Transcript_24149/g.56354 Transcript_24149/m.56354 type:complete len:127 (+) Transcript_24149:764-1144(+)